MEARALQPLAVIEDSDEDFEALSRVLRETTAYDGVKRYVSGEEALAGLLEGRDRRPALILLDLNLPGIRGIDVLAALKRDRRVRAVPVIVLSGSSREEDVDAAYDAGANAYLSKPLDYTELRRIVLSLHEFWRVASLPGQGE
ncbi:response regulator [Solirubrobacter sp. CPCC 204708]|uniref:Response regulator n=1 Tax=Solirubrobacter deserti TaxID=2282478 RepID=A0ABT4RHP2_9ACTN|nr:response regulator [Solirubrobacter deserti]MBE2316534.1 response regulator [Solirubrobacter deserti]MDA0138068.1 response regulator [Solirubrobacter deserti]